MYHACAVNRWQQPDMEGRDVAPIMDALASIACRLGPGFEPYAPAVFEKAMQVLIVQQEARKAQVSPACVTKCLTTVVGGRQRR
jgi:hypothetical protein